MWTEKLKNGKYRYAERYLDPLTGKQKKVSIVLDKNTSQTKKQAQIALTAKIEELLNIKDDIEKITFKTLIEEYRKDQLLTVKRTTYTRNFCSCNTFLKIFGEDLLVKKINAGLIRTTLLATQKEPPTLNEYLARLKALLRWGYKNDFIENISYLNKIDNFKDKPHRAKIQDKFLESDEVQKVLNHMQVTKWRELTQFLILSGLRAGEAFALTVSDVDLNQRLIHVSKTYSSITREVSTPKTLCSIRDVYIQDELLPLCKKIKKHALAQRLVTGCNLFFQDEGEVLRYPAYNSYLKENVEAVIGRPITTHALRHTHASLLLEQGVDIDTISRRLGHENSKITKEIYIHITKKLQERDYQKISNVKIL